MVSLFQSLSIYLVLSTWGICSVLRSGYPGTNKGRSIGLLSQTGQNATSGDEKTVLPDDTTLDGDWLVEADRRNLRLQPLNTPSLNTTAAGSPTYSCDGRAFGRNLNLQSCVQAMDLMSDYHLLRTYGERGGGRCDVSLPFRFLSSDGLCAIDISHRKGADFDTMIPDEMKLHARALIDICIRGNPNQGGIVSNLGLHGTLALRVTPYRPRVQCGVRGTAPPWMARREVLDVMPANDLPQRFGHVDDPTAQVVVPKRYTEVSRRCGFTVDTMGSTDVANWYKLWAAAISVEVMCIEARQAGGVAFGLGEDKKLYVILGNIEPDTPAVGFTSGNMSKLAASYS